jgi:Enoyl-(Acyl carrier protein) reductase
LADWRRQTAINLDGVFLSVKIRCSGHPSGWGRLDHHHVVGCRPSRIGGSGRLLRDQGRRAPVRQSRRDGVRGRSDGIRINTVHPGVIDTPIWTKISSSAGRNTPIDPNEASKSGVPLGRVGQAQDIANGVLFLASDASSYMTGAELVIDGGMTGGAVRRWT